MLTVLCAVIKKLFFSSPKQPTTTTTTATATHSPGAVQNLTAGGGTITIYAPPHLAVPATDAVAAFNELVATLKHNATLQRDIEVERGKSAVEQAKAQAERARAQELAERAKSLEEQLTQTFAALDQLKEQNPGKAAKIEAALGPGTSATVADASGDGRHVVVDVVSPSFAEAKSTMQRQRAVFKALWEELSDDGMVHAVDAMTTRTPEEAAAGGQ